MASDTDRAFVDQDGDVILNSAQVAPAGENSTHRLLLVPLTGEQADGLARVDTATLEVLEARVREDMVITLGEARSRTESGA